MFAKPIFAHNCSRLASRFHTDSRQCLTEALKNPAYADDADVDPKMHANILCKKLSFVFYRVSFRRFVVEVSNSPESTRHRGGSRSKEVLLEQSPGRNFNGHKNKLFRSCLGYACRQPG